MPTPRTTEARTTTTRRTTPRRTTRQGSAPKRAAILAAARELFVRDGVERTSMDAVAAHAGVSKRTVYDYYGDKRSLLLGVIVAAGESLLTSFRAALAAHLADDAPIDDIDALESALADFAVQVGLEMLTSDDYNATYKLVSENGALLPELQDHPLDTAPEEAMAERLSHYAGRGLLDLEDATLAADHLTALTTLRAFNSPFPLQHDSDRMRRIMTDGVHVFMRAYAHR